VTEQPGEEPIAKAEVLTRIEAAARIRRGGGALPLPAVAPLREAAPTLARAATMSGWRMLTWTISTSLAGSRAVVRATLNGEPPAAVMQSLGADLRSAAWRALGLGEDVDDRGVPESVAPTGSTTDDLQSRGADLLRRSNDVRITEDSHPAYARILAEITPDEARILRFLYQQGPQPAIDVRTNRPLGIGSELVAGGLSMIAEHAGCRNVDRIHPYLTNLFRLGMIEFSKEQVTNPQRYQLVEAQPKVSEAIKRAGRWPRTVHRSIHLNSFGEDFCAACLPPRPDGG
jgi:hypothetical protein